MSRQFEINPFLPSKYSKQHLQLSCADFQIEFKKGTLVGHFEIKKFGRPEKSKATNPPAPERTKNAKVQK